MTRDALLAIVGVALLAFVASGMVDRSVAPTLVLVAGGLCGLPVFFGIGKKGNGSGT